MSPRVRADGRGFALLLVLLALLVLTGFAVAAAGASLGQVRSAAAALGVSTARAIAASGLELAVGSAPEAPSGATGGPAVELARGELAPGLLWRVQAFRVTEELHVLVGESPAGRRVSAREPRLAWWMVPEIRVAAHRAVLEAGSHLLHATAQVRVDSVLAGRPGVAPCEDSAPLDASFRNSPPPVGPLPDPPEWGDVTEGSSFATLRLGWFDPERLRQSADVVLSGSATFDGCPTCWTGLVFGDGAVALAGSGAGVLAVEGDLALAPGSTWSGLLLVAGDLTLGPGSRLLGLARAGGAAELAEAAIVDGSACVAVQSLGAAFRLARPIPFPGRSWIGPVSPATR